MTPIFNVDDIVRFINKDVFYHQARKGSKGKILSISQSLNKYVYWTKFKNCTEQIYEYQLEHW